MILPSAKPVRAAVVGFIICVLLSGCARNNDLVDQASIDFLAGGDEFSKFRREYDRRVSELVERCLRRAGFDPAVYYHDFGPPVPEVSAEDMKYYGIVDNLRLAQRHDELLSQTSTTVVAPSIEMAAYYETLDGNEDTPGCRQESEAIADSEFRIPEVEAIASRIGEIADNLGVADGYQARVDDWTACMRAQGIDGLTGSSSIFELVFQQWLRDMEEQDGSDRALELERSIFLAEQECPSLKGASPLEQTAERILESNPDVQELLEQLLTSYDPESR